MSAMVSAEPTEAEEGRGVVQRPEALYTGVAVTGTGRIAHAQQVS